MCRFQPADASQVSKQLTSRDELKDEIEIPGVLAESFEIHNEGMIEVS
jgi:hypothetical protein